MHTVQRGGRERRSCNKATVFTAYWNEKTIRSKTIVEYDKRINIIEVFWSYAKERFMKYHGIWKHNYYWHMKEMELTTFHIIIKNQI